LPAQTEKWKAVTFQRHRDDDLLESCPTEVFLASCPQLVRLDLLSIIHAVVDAPPPRFPGGGMWEAMHGSMAGIYEIRTRGPNRRLYRLFCVLERRAPGLDVPSLVLITGKSKPVGTRMDEAEYDEVRELVREYYSRTPRSVV
jgi:hypothetical protein